ncbi:hypothetical protein KC327_g97 [Hortaea werneckii]|nr:hypothetical protein KC327_g97 [Hortaea werneckii]
MHTQRPACPSRALLAPSSLSASPCLPSPCLVVIGSSHARERGHSLLAFDASPDYGRNCDSPAPVLLLNALTNRNMLYRFKRRIIGDTTVSSLSHPVRSHVLSLVLPFLLEVIGSESRSFSYRTASHPHVVERSTIDYLRRTHICAVVRRKDTWKGARYAETDMSGYSRRERGPTNTWHPPEKVYCGSRMRKARKCMTANMVRTTSEYQVYRKTPSRHWPLFLRGQKTTLEIVIPMFDTKMEPWPSKCHKEAAHLEYDSSTCKRFPNTPFPEKTCPPKSPYSPRKSLLRDSITAQILPDPLHRLLEPLALDQNQMPLRLNAQLLKSPLRIAGALITNLLVIVIAHAHRVAMQGLVFGVEIEPSSFDATSGSLSSTAAAISDRIMLYMGGTISLGMLMKRSQVPQLLLGGWLRAGFGDEVVG